MSWFGVWGSDRSAGGCKDCDRAAQAEKVLIAPHLVLSVTNTSSKMAIASYKTPQLPVQLAQ